MIRLIKQALLLTVTFIIHNVTAQNYTNPIDSILVPAIDFYNKLITNRTLIENIAIGARIPPIGRDLSTVVNANNPAYAHLADYGCWCKFSTGDFGRGKPVDYIDRLCKQLAENYYCVDEEAKTNGESCDSRTTMYNAGMVYTYVATAASMKLLNQAAAEESLQDAYNYCNQHNNGICNKQACQVEIKWSYDILVEGLLPIGSQNRGNLLNEKKFYNPVYQNKNPDTCDTVIPTHSAIECCGMVPNYNRFHTNSKGCCDGTVYNTLAAHCVDDVVVDLFL